MLTTVITSLVAALCVAGVFAVIKSRWLYLIAPKLYINTTLSNGQIISLTLLNAGLLTEEDIVVKIKSGCKFELVGSSKAALTVSGTDILLPR